MTKEEQDILIQAGRDSFRTLRKFYEANGMWRKAMNLIHEEAAWELKVLEAIESLT